ncbi:MAG TPA: response regulator [Gemmatimonadaceae bacterium]|nr:response regulator [Gemmatimonadaceae bacterium]
MKIYDERARVLVVDDEPSICRALSIALSRAGYEVRAVESGEIGATLVRSEHFDCLITDLRIPDMRGDVLFELASSLQPHLRNRTIFTTGDASEHAQDLLLACSCTVLQKPFDLDELLGVVRRFTRRLSEASA